MKSAGSENFICYLGSKHCCVNVLRKGFGDIMQRISEIEESVIERERLTIGQIISDSVKTRLSK